MLFYIYCIYFTCMTEIPFQVRLVRLQGHIFKCKCHQCAVGQPQEKGPQGGIRNGTEGFCSGKDEMSDACEYIFTLINDGLNTLCGARLVATFGLVFSLKFRLPLVLHRSYSMSPTASGTFKNCFSKYHDWPEATQCRGMTWYSEVRIWWQNGISNERQ